MTALLIGSCGPATSIQDRGRFGWQRYGLASSGAADPLALAAANLLVGNPPDMAGIELALIGLTLQAVGGSARLALAGAPMQIAVEGKPVATHTSFLLEAGRTLRIGPATAGVYAILSVEGGLDIAPELGSRSLHARAAVGGLKGRPLGTGSEVPLLCACPAAKGESQLEPLPLYPDRPLRVVLGPQDDYFTPEALQTFLNSEYAVTAQADRMGYRLAGPALSHTKGFNIVSDGIVCGSVQVPGSGEPIIMLVDRQTTGGYPKIATVISQDLRVLAQRRPGDRIRFKAVTVEEAQATSRTWASETDILSKQLRPAGSGLPDSGELLAMNVAGAALSAHDPATWHG